MQRWKGSNYSFKSPHWKIYMGKIFNQLNEVAGDPWRVPYNKPKNITVKESRDTPENLTKSDEIVSMMVKFRTLDNYSSLELLERILP